MANPTTEPTLVCPHCSQTIRLTEALAAPLIEAARREALSEVSEREKTISAREAALRKAKASIDEEVAQKLLIERESLIKTAREEANAASALGLKELRDQLDSKGAALKKAQDQELALRKVKRELEEQKESWELEKERQIDAERGTIREKAQSEVEARFRLKEAEKDELIKGMTRQIDDLKRKAEQGSQQLQGEVLELDVEGTLRLAFPLDTIDPVAKGVRGADCLHRVNLPSGACAGSILWESKRTKSWSDGWLPKLREDQREEVADIAILVSACLPKGVERFKLMDGVWVTDLPSSIPLAHALRFALVGSAAARAASEGRETKMGLLYEYLCGPHFRQRLEAIVEAFSTMKADLDREKKALTAAWAKREKQIERALLGATGMYGDLQGLAGSSLPHLPALELPEGTEPVGGSDLPTASAGS